MLVVLCGRVRRGGKELEMFWSGEASDIAGSQLARGRKMFG